MKRLLFTILATLAIVNMYATGFETINGLRYLIDTDAKTATLVADTVKYSGDIVVPEKVTLAGIDYPVVAFAPKSFNGCDSLKSVAIPPSVLSLGERCFFNCEAMTSVNMPSSVTSMGIECFYNCKSLKSVTISSSVTNISEDCFYGCESLSSVILPEDVTTLGKRCFKWCVSLSSIIIPSSVIMIGESCFETCRSLKSIDIPQSVTKLEKDCFSGCYSLTSVNIPPSVTTIGDNCFESCKFLPSIKIPSSVTELGAFCFRGCDALSLIELPTSIKKIGVACFRECKSLETIEIPYSVEEFGIDNFEGSSKLSSVYCYSDIPPHVFIAYFNTKSYSFYQPSTSILYVPAASIEEYKQANGWKDFIAILPIPGTEGQETQKCEIPKIAFSDGKLHFASSTTGASYHYTLTNNDVATNAYSENGEVALNAAYNITAYATADGYSPSDKVTATLYWVDGKLDDPTGITPAKAKRGIVVSNQNGTVTLSGLDDGEQVTFYSIDGSNLGTTVARQGVAASPSAPGQVVIVKLGDTSLKVAL